MIGASLWLLVELVALFFGVAFAVHLFQRRFGAERLRAWMGGSSFRSAIKGIAIGFITPFCTYSAIPMLVGLRQAGVPPAGYVAFLTAAPVLDPVLFGALVVIVGIEAALVYAVVAFIAALSLALVAQRVGIERHLKPIPLGLGSDAGAGAELEVEVEVDAGVDARLGVGAGAAAAMASPPVPPSVTAAGDRAAENQGCGPVTDRPWAGLRRESPEAARAAISLLRSVAALLVVGVGLGLLIEALVSPETVATITGDNGPWSIPLAAALGTPLYVQTSVFVPIANSLTAAGVGIGAIVALTISGAGANVPEFVILTRLAKRRLIAVFFVYVFAVALGGGLIAQTLLG